MSEQIDTTKFDELPKYFFVMVKVILGEKGMAYFKENHDKHGTISPVGVIEVAGQLIPHSVHMNEGMRFRNFLKDQVECEDWNQDDLDNLWIKVIERAIGIGAKCETKDSNT